MECRNRCLSYRVAFADERGDTAYFWDNLKTIFLSIFIDLYLKICSSIPCQPPPGSSSFRSMGAVLGKTRSEFQA